MTTQKWWTNFAHNKNLIMGGEGSIASSTFFDGIGQFFWWGRPTFIGGGRPTFIGGVGSSSRDTSIRESVFSTFPKNLDRFSSAFCGFLKPTAENFQYLSLSILLDLSLFLPAFLSLTFHFSTLLFNQPPFPSPVSLYFFFWVSTKLSRSCPNIFFHDACGWCFGCFLFPLSLFFLSFLLYFFLSSLFSPQPTYLFFSLSFRSSTFLSLFSLSSFYSSLFPPNYYFSSTPFPSFPSELCAY